MKSHAEFANSVLKGLIITSPLLLLLALIYPAFRKEHEYKKSGVCLSSLKKLAIALNQYVQDYDNVTPLAGRNDLLGTSWGNALHLYLYTDGMLQCAPGGVYVAPDILQTTHAVNYYLNANLTQRKLTAIKAPENILLFGEGESASSNYACFSLERCTGLNDYGPVGPVPESARTRHYSGANYVFVDGHVKWIKPDKVKAKPGKDVNYTFVFR